MNMFRAVVIFSLLLIASVAVFADDNGVLIKTRIVMNVPASMKLKFLEDKIKYLVDQRTDKYNEYKGIMPDEITDVPSEAIQGNITKISTVDKQWFTVIGFYNSNCTIVHGE